MGILVWEKHCHVNNCDTIVVNKITHTYETPRKFCTFTAVTVRTAALHAHISEYTVYGRWSLSIPALQDNIRAYGATSWARKCTYFCGVPYAVLWICNIGHIAKLFLYAYTTALFTIPVS